MSKVSKESLLDQKESKKESKLSDKALGVVLIVILMSCCLSSPPQKSNKNKSIK
jgi:hypothetical protein